MPVVTSYPLESQVPGHRAMRHVARKSKVSALDEVDASPHLPIRTTVVLYPV